MLQDNLSYHMGHMFSQAHNNILTEIMKDNEGVILLQRVIKKNKAFLCFENDVCVLLHLFSLV